MAVVAVADRAEVVSKKGRQNFAHEWQRLVSPFKYSAVLLLKIATTVEAMRAELFFGQTDGCNQPLDGIESQRREP